jgi:general secretion pathway protein A
MYNEYFGFKEAPFSIAPDPRYLYMTAQHREALAHLVYGLNSEGGCILLTGEVGTGKTTICRCLLEQIPDQANVALVLNPKVNETELLESICDELHINYPDTDNSPKTYTDRIYSFLIESNRRNEKTVLIIDEAQNLDSKVLEQLRLLTNLETNQRKLLQIIILGQPELLTILAKTEMRQLAQRITARFHLQPLNKHEVKAYISHRLAVAGQSIQLFPENSIKLLYKLSNGVPRLINILCDRALLGAYVENQYSVNPGIVKKAATEVFGELKNVEKHQRNMRWLYPITAISGIVVIVILLSFYLHKTGKFEQFTQQAPVAERDNTTSTDSAPSIANLDAAVDNQATENVIVDEVQITDDSKPDSENSITTAAGEGDNALINADSEVNFIDEEQPVEDIENKGIKQEFDDIETIIKSAARNSDSAYRELFNTWNLPFKSNKTSACKQAEKLSLSCLFRQGGTDDLKSHNRPAVMTLINDLGAKRYITITKINGDIATIYSNNKAYSIRLQDLEKYWRGHYTLLWNKPEHYSSIISPGDSGEMIDWLKLQLEKINHTSAPDLVIGRYDDYLIEKVKTFQSQQGLITDGIVGPVTIIHLNNMLGIDAPQLNSAPVQSSIQTVTNQN